MKRVALGAFAALALSAVGLFWWQGKAEVQRNAPPPSTEPPLPAASDLPTDAPANMRGPAPPQATELTREQQRFFRYDRNRDLRITRNEMLSTRSAAFRKLDKDGNNLLSFEEWAHATAERFDKADRNGDGILDQTEFKVTAPKRSAKKPKCEC